MEVNPLDLAALEIEELALSKLKAAFKAGMLHAAEIAEEDALDCIGCAREQHDCRQCVAHAIRTAAEK